MKTSEKTHLFNLEIVDKDDLRIEAVGSIDEANAFIGLAKTKLDDDELREILEKIQGMMFKAGSHCVGGKVKIEDEDYRFLIETIEELSKRVRLPNGFIFLEKDETTAFLSVARSVVRRAERRAVTLYKKGMVEYLLVEWLNKLNYLLYLMILVVQKGDYKYVRT